MVNFNLDEKGFGTVRRKKTTFHRMEFCPDTIFVTRPGYSASYTIKNRKEFALVIKLETKKEMSE